MVSYEIGNQRSYLMERARKRNVRRFLVGLLALSLLGSSFAHAATAAERGITPLTCPASEFHVTQPPILNFFFMTIPSLARAF